MIHYSDTLNISDYMTEMNFKSIAIVVTFEYSNGQTPNNTQVFLFHNSTIQESLDSLENDFIDFVHNKHNILTVKNIICSFGTTYVL